MDLRINQVQFDEEKHEYWYTEGNRHLQLHGVTGAIGKILGKNFPDTDTVMLATMYGHDVHKESELWITEGKEPSTNAGKWLVKFLKDYKVMHGVTHFDAELTVSDFIATASCIDIVAHSDEGDTLFDIKTTSSFDRAYCSLQLSVYKRLYEKNYGRTVKDMYVLSTKSQRAFHIIEQSAEKIDRVLAVNVSKLF